MQGKQKRIDICVDAEKETEGKKKRREKKKKKKRGRKKGQTRQEQFIKQIQPIFKHRRR